MIFSSGIERSKKVRFSRMLARYPEHRNKVSYLQVAARSLENEAPYFVDYISQELQDRYKVTGAVDVYTTLDVHLQKIAQEEQNGD